MQYRISCFVPLDPGALLLTQFRLQASESHWRLRVCQKTRNLLFPLINTRKRKKNKKRFTTTPPPPPTDPSVLDRLWRMFVSYRLTSWTFRFCCPTQELVFSLLYDDIVLLLAVIVLNQKWGFSKVVQLEYVFGKVSSWWLCSSFTLDPGLLSF